VNVSIAPEPSHAELEAITMRWKARARTPQPAGPISFAFTAVVFVGYVVVATLLAVPSLFSRGAGGEVTPHVRARFRACWERAAG
jgi:hypothetical protein